LEVIYKQLKDAYLDSQLIIILLINLQMVRHEMEENDAAVTNESKTVGIRPRELCARVKLDLLAFPIPGK
jgi:hypothetical protein